ncbi:MAG: hypothetical protein ABSG36_13440 [Acidimicrobiales bacterium]|jgi:hypothetical protein
MRESPDRDNFDSDKAPLRERLRGLVLKPATPGEHKAPAGPRTVAELEAAVASADDKERLIGLIAAPLAAAIGILVISALIVNDPPALLKNGQINSLHVSLSLYHDLGGVVLALSILMLGTALWRKRLYLGIVSALYGLAIFNLHYWGFGIPFILFGAWLLVRAYRFQRDLREATEEYESASAMGAHRDKAATRRSPPKPNRRYTPPNAVARRSRVQKPES